MAGRPGREMMAAQRPDAGKTAVSDPVSVLQVTVDNFEEALRISYASARYC